MIIPNTVSQFGSTAISLPEQSDVAVTVYDLTGKLVKRIEAGSLNIVDQQVIWDLKEDGVKPGVNIINVNGNNFSRSGKLILVK